MLKILKNRMGYAILLITPMILSVLITFLISVKTNMIYDSKMIISIIVSIIVYLFFMIIISEITDATIMDIDNGLIVFLIIPIIVIITSVSMEKLREDQKYIISTNETENLYGELTKINNENYIERKENQYTIMVNTGNGFKIKELYDQDVLIVYSDEEEPKLVEPVKITKSKYKDNRITRFMNISQNDIETNTNKIFNETYKIYIPKNNESP